MGKPTTEQVALFEAFMYERFGIEPGIAEDGSHYFERWQIEDALERELQFERWEIEDAIERELQKLHDEEERQK